MTVEIRPLPRDIMSALEFHTARRCKNTDVSTYHTHMAQVITILHVVATTRVLACVECGSMIVRALNTGRGTVFGTWDVDSQYLMGQAGA